MYASVFHDHNNNCFIPHLGVCHTPCVCVYFVVCHLLACCLRLFPFRFTFRVAMQIPDMENVFRGEFREELMCIMHFQILVLLSAEARLQREVGVSRL